MKRKIWISTVAGAILVLGTAANMSDNPSQSPSDDSVVINDWLIVGEPDRTFRPGEGSLMVGYSRATGRNSMAIGGSANSTGSNSVAMGLESRASGYSSFSMGGFIGASGAYSVAMGRTNNANGNSSIAIGEGLQAHGSNTTVVGRFNETNLAGFGDDPNVENADGHLFVVGNGSSFNDRSNAMVVYHDGAVDVGKNGADDTVPLQVTSDGTVTVNGAIILSEAQGDISMGAFGSN